jgi:hypothetical protein
MMFSLLAVLSIACLPSVSASLGDFKPYPASMRTQKACEARALAYELSPAYAKDPVDFRNGILHALKIGLLTIPPVYDQSNTRVARQSSKDSLFDLMESPAEKLRRLKSTVVDQIRETYATKLNALHIEQRNTMREMANAKRELADKMARLEKSPYFEGQVENHSSECDDQKSDDVDSVHSDVPSSSFSHSASEFSGPSFNGSQTHVGDQDDNDVYVMQGG